MIIQLYLAIKKCGVFFIFMFSFLYYSKENLLYFIYHISVSLRSQLGDDLLTG